MPSHIYNVKQAAKILGLSTNTTYKYLNEGRIRAARGHVRGTFIITHKALENFLDTKLPDDPLKEIDPHNTIPGLDHAEDAYIEISPPNFTVQVSRIILIICLLLLILSQTIGSSFPIIHTLSLGTTYFLFMILLYQFGGFTKK